MEGDMLNQHRYATMLSTALFGLLVTACGGSDNSAGEPAAIVECPASYAVTLLPVPPLSSSSAAGLNNLGQAVGEIGGDAAVWSSGSFSAVPNTFGGFNSLALAVNDSGLVVGAAETGTAGVYHAFRFRSGTMPEDLGTLGGSSSLASGINQSGQIVGSARVTGNASSHAFLYDNDAMQDLGTLGGSASNAAAINTSGQIVGGAQIGGNAATHAFLYENGSMLDLGTLGGMESTASAISDGGRIAGSSQPSGSTDFHAFHSRHGIRHQQPGPRSREGRRGCLANRLACVPLLRRNVDGFEYPRTG
jgi:probable HAF family extracellular repeat protein